MSFVIVRRRQLFFDTPALFLPIEVNLREAESISQPLQTQVSPVIQPYRCF